MAKYFGTNGVRRLYDELTPDFVAGLCNAFAEWAGKGTILVARDTRVTGEVLEHAVLAGLLSAGNDVVRLGIAPSPLVEWRVRQGGTAGAVIITASHNPPEWNALKFVDGQGMAVSRERGEEIERIFEGRRKHVTWGEVGGERADGSAQGEYIRAVAAAVDRKAIARARLSLILDCGNGTACGIGPTLFRRLGCRVEALNSQPDGFFPGRASEPTEANIKDLIESVREAGADAGMAWDGDCDRVVMVDERGNYVIGDRVFALCARIKLESHRGPVVSTVSTTRAVEDIAKKFGQETVYCKVGAPYISERMREIGAVIGGEEVGGVVWPEHSWGKDGFYSAAKIVERMAVEGKRLSELLAELPRYYNAKTKIEVPPQKKAEAVARIAEEMAGRGRLTTIDGARLDVRDGWVIARASGTENYIRVFAEAKSAERANALMQEWATRVRRLL
ncbi:MAG: phosphoglucosamine mutase [Candidatus Micrarchaeia archaeon]